MITATPIRADEGADDVVAVRTEAVEGHAPRERSGDEYAAVGGKDPSEVRVGLERGDELVEKEREAPEKGECPASALSD